MEQWYYDSTRKPEDIDQVLLDVEKTLDENINYQEAVDDPFDDLDAFLARDGSDHAIDADLVRSRQMAIDAVLMD